MVAHPAIGQQGKATLVLILPQALEVLFAVLVIQKNGLSVDPPEHDVIDAALTLAPRMFWHKLTFLVFVPLLSAGAGGGGTDQGHQP